MKVSASCVLKQAPSTGGQYREGKWACRKSGVKGQPVASKQFKTGGGYCMCLDLHRSISAKESLSFQFQPCIGHQARSVLRITCCHGNFVLSDNCRSAQAEMGIWLIWQHFVKRPWQQLTFIMSINISVIIVQTQRGRQLRRCFKTFI